MLRGGGFTIFLLRQEISANVWKVENRWEWADRWNGHSLEHTPRGSQKGSNAGPGRDSTLELRQKRELKAGHYPQVCTWDYSCLSLQSCPLLCVESVLQHLSQTKKQEAFFVNRASKLSGNVKDPDMHVGDLPWRSPHSDIWGAL